MGALVSMIFSASNSVSFIWNPLQLIWIFIWVRKLKGCGYKCIAQFVDDVMCFSDNPQKILDYLGKFYTLKGVRYPQFYLGNDVFQFLDTWDKEYNLSTHNYITTCVGTLESMCETTMFTLANTPFDSKYYPEEDTTIFFALKSSLASIHSLGV